jgi:hypothetical protein
MAAHVTLSCIQYYVLYRHVVCVCVFSITGRSMIILRYAPVAHQKTNVHGCAPPVEHMLRTILAIALASSVCAKTHSGTKR